MQQQQDCYDLSVCLLLLLWLLPPLLLGGGVLALWLGRRRRAAATEDDGAPKLSAEEQVRLERLMAEGPDRTS